MAKIYLDYAATTPVHPEVVKAMLPFFDRIYANPSSIYQSAQASRSAIESAREKVARVINAEREEIVFTSGGTESDNAAIKGIAYANSHKGDHVITSKAEHYAVLNSCKWLEKEGFKITYLNVDNYGVVDLEELKRNLTSKTILISIMHANNEVGIIQPVEEIAEIAEANGIYFHTDAVQTVGNIPVDVKELGVDLLSLSAHKIYGPKGVGALYVKKNTTIVPLIHGGHQERGQRAGTENVPGIVGLGKACEIAMKEGVKKAEKIKKLRDMLFQRLKEKISGISLNGHPEKKLPGILNICVKYVEGESMRINLDLEGIYVSGGSACTSSSVESSHVLLAMGILPELAHGSLRFSLGRYTTEQEIEKVADVLPSIVDKLRAISPLTK